MVFWAGPLPGRRMHGGPVLKTRSKGRDGLVLSHGRSRTIRLLFVFVVVFSLSIFPGIISPHSIISSVPADPVCVRCCGPRPPPHVSLPPAPCLSHSPTPASP